MGKTESGAVWLSAERTSPDQFYQYWINVDDADAGKCRAVPHRASAGRNRSTRSVARGPTARRSSQKRLAESLTELVHGPAGLAAARGATEIFFGAEIVELSDRQLGEIFADVPSEKLGRARLEGPGLNIIDGGLRSEACPVEERGPAHCRARRRRRQQPPDRRDRHAAGPPAFGERVGPGAAQRAKEVRAAAVRVSQLPPSGHARVLRLRQSPGLGE